MFPWQTSIPSYLCPQVPDFRAIYGSHQRAALTDALLKATPSDRYRAFTLQLMYRILLHYVLRVEISFKNTSNFRVSSVRLTFMIEFW